jgi:predicted transcriptional regulator
MACVAMEAVKEVSRMSSVKDQILQIIGDQPDDSSYDEILRELAFVRMVERGLSDSEAGRTVSHEEMGRRIRTWQS